MFILSEVCVFIIIKFEKMFMLFLIHKQLTVLNKKSCNKRKKKKNVI